MLTGLFVASGPLRRIGRATTWRDIGRLLDLGDCCLIRLGDLEVEMAVLRRYTL
jgi:hypothetical protein